MVQLTLGDLPSQDLVLFGWAVFENFNQVFLPRLQACLHIGPAEFMSRRTHFIREI